MRTVIHSTRQGQVRSAGLTFADELALAVIEGTKTETRRPIAHATPKLKAGDLLYGRVTFIPGTDGVPTYRFMYGEDEIESLSRSYTWTPAIHAPKAVAPFIVTLTEVIDEPIQNITEEQAKAEGVCPQFRVSFAEFVNKKAPLNSTYRDGFINTWNAIYGKQEGLKWDDNPTVRVYRWNAKDVKLHESLAKEANRCSPV